MKAGDLLIVGVKNKVLALSRVDGRIQWSTDLPSGMGSGFVTVISDGLRVFAHGNGQLSCLDLMSGAVLWTNELRGCGYGLASLSLPDGTSAPSASAAQSIIAAQQAASATNAV